MHKSLRLDQIVTSQPELGPSAPDGGYGWIILLACILIQLMVPSILAAYGTFLLFDQIENLTHTDEYLLWDHEITIVPIVFIAFWSLADAWFGSFANTFKWPKTVVFCGFCLICSGNLITWVAELHEPTIILYYFIAGAISGIGASLIIQQCEYLIKQYFQHKYIVAKNVLYLSNIIGFIITPLILGNLIIIHGVLETMLAYQVILTFIVLASFVFKKPNFTLPETSTYNLLDTSSCEDEQLVFNKTIIEVQPSTSTYTNNNDVESSQQNNLETLKSNELEQNKQSLQKKIDLDQIDVYNDEIHSNTSKNKIEIRNHIRRSYSEEYQNDLDRRVSNDADDTRLYTDNNVTFSYENNSIYNEQSIPINSHHASINSKSILNLIQLADTIELFKTPIFYKFMLLIFVEKLSILVFWALYPSVIYNEVDLLNVHTTIMCITFVAIGGLVFTIFWNCFRIPRTTIKIFLSISFFIASVGFTLITSGESKNLIIFGGILSTTSLSSIHVLSEIFVLQNTDGINHYAHKLVNIIVGSVIFTAAFLDIEYTECFQAVALLQFVVASLWLANVIYKKIKKLFE